MRDLLWLRIIKAKYPGAANLFNYSSLGGSRFWHSLHKIKDFFKQGAKFSLGNSRHILF